MLPLPIDPLLPQVVDALRGASRLVLRAPPGAGKTTRVPAALLDAGLAGERSVLVLEPRRIAARAAASFVAAERGGAVGHEVGYRVRFEQRGGQRTRLWFVTEGVLGRQLASDPFLEEAAIVVLDEFHERHMQGDIALAVVRELQATVRPDLKLVVMSATLETSSLARYLGDCPVLTSEGRAFAVDVAYQSGPDDRPLSARVATALWRAVEGDPNGDVLVFLPGANEIRRAAQAIEPLAAERDLEVLPLHGDLPLDEQQRVLGRGRRRKVVLSTNVAETSLTIDGVTVVIDSGLARTASFDARRGVNVLRTVPISRASAEQRAGRAGRTAPGRCFRLWTEAEHHQRLEREVPEILRLDLADTVLQLRAWGQRDLAQFGWLDAPRAGILQGAESLLVRLGAIEPASGAVTDLGRRMLTVAAHPRLARLLVEGERRDCLEEAALAAALASERDICFAERTFGAAAPVRWPTGPSDLLHRAELFRQAERGGFDRATCTRLGLDPAAVRAADRSRRQLLRMMRSSSSGRAAQRQDAEATLRSILAGFADRVVRRRAPGSRRGTMVGGSGVVLGEGSVVREAELFVAVDVEAGERGGAREARIRLASAIEEPWLAETFPAAVRTERGLEFDERGGRVVERTRRLYEDLVLGETVRTDVDRAAAGEVLAAAARRDPERAAALGDGERSFLDRLRFLRRWMPELELPDTTELVTEAVVALSAGQRSLAELRAADLLPVLQGMLTHAQRSALEREAPQRYELPSGRSVAVAYDEQKPPAVAARVQEIFGLTATPRLAGGRVALVFEILAPNRRPVQVTDDLESFWKRGYPEVRKQLRGRYPKHAWPEDPLAGKKR